MVGLLGDHDAATIDALASALHQLSVRRKIFVVASTDLLHDADYDRAQEIAERYNAQPFKSMDALGDACDAASIVVPTDRHFDVFQRMLTHQLHMLVEKPIASSYEQAKAMVTAAEANGVVLQVGHVERFNPIMTFLEENLSHARFIEATRLAPYPPPREGAAPRGTEVSVVLDLMIHDLDIILQIANSPVKSINATGVSVMSPTQDIANARINFENG